jgi:hypothetical protein
VVPPGYSPEIDWERVAAHERSRVIVHPRGRRAAHAIPTS